MPVTKKKTKIVARRILIVDDHKIIRDGLSALLSGCPEVEIVGECEDGSQVLPFLRKNNVDVILMDINMKKMNGIVATQEVKSAYPKSKILILTMHNEESFVHKVLQNGADGYVLKNTGKTELIKAINALYKGKTFFSKEISDMMVNKFVQKQSQKLEFKIGLNDLSEREIEILKLIAKENTSAEIADHLGLSNRTIDSHRRNLAMKIGVKNTVGLIKFAMHYHLVK